MIIADTNLIAYLLIQGPFTEDAETVLGRDGDWLAPTVWQHELLNVLATSVRAGHLEKDRAMNVWLHAPAFVRDAEVPPLDVLHLACESKFATYDCNYVVLARQMGCRLVTADKRLLEAFPDCGVSIKDFADGK